MTSDELADRFGADGWASLVNGPTPVDVAPRLAVALGLGADDLRVKRDDLIGLGAGGN